MIFILPNLTSAQEEVLKKSLFYLGIPKKSAPEYKYTILELPETHYANKHYLYEHN